MHTTNQILLQYKMLSVHQSICNTDDYNSDRQEYHRNMSVESNYLLLELYKMKIAHSSQ